MIELNDRLFGSVLGNAVGDALGSSAEFTTRVSLKKQFPNGVREMMAASQTLSKKPGSYTDDTEMLVCIAKGILDSGFFDPAAISKRFHEWYLTHPPDVGCHTSAILSRIGDRYDEGADISLMYCDDHGSGNGSVMRHGIMLPFTISTSLTEALLLSEHQSILTHSSKQCTDSCKFLTLVQRCLCEGMDGKASIKWSYGFAQERYYHPKLLEAIKSMMQTKNAEALPTSGWVIDTVERALWPVYKDMDFEEGLVACVSQGGDADSAGAVCGTVLGAMHGMNAIPSRWLEAVLENESLSRDSKLMDMTEEVIKIGKDIYGTIS